jgi:hypothetical protein
MPEGLAKFGGLFKALADSATDPEKDIGPEEDKEDGASVTVITPTEPDTYSMAEMEAFSAFSDLANSDATRMRALDLLMKSRERKSRK